MGEPGWRERAGEYAYLNVGGCLCPRCFSRRAEAKGIQVWLWVVRVDEYLALDRASYETWRGERTVTS